MAELNKGAPKVGLRFKSADEAWQFWVAYGGHTGFDVRKRYTNVSALELTFVYLYFMAAHGSSKKRGNRSCAEVF